MNSIKITPDVAIRSIPCHEEHLKMFTPRDIYAGEDFQETARLYIKSPMCASHTLLKDNEILGCFGFVIIWKGVAETWSLFSESIVKYKMEFTDKCLLIQDFYERSLGLHRVHCYVKADYEKAIKWAEKLKYKREGLLESFGKSGEDYFIMARTRKNGGITWQL